MMRPLMLMRSLWIVRMMVAGTWIPAGPRVGLTRAAAVMHPALQVVEVELLHKLPLK